MKEDKGISIGLDAWETPASKYPRKRVGTARIRTHMSELGTYRGYRTRVPASFTVNAAAPGEMVPDVIRADFINVLKPIRTTELTIGNQTWMVDDPPHWWGIQEIAEEYEGHVLCAGLGLGLVVWALSWNPKVKRITVVERNTDVIDLIWPHLPYYAADGFPVPNPRQGLNIMAADYWDADKTRIEDAGLAPVTGVFFDLFRGHGQDLLDEAVEALRWNRSRYPGAHVRIFGFPTWILEAKMVGEGAWEQYKREHPLEYDEYMRALQEDK